MTQNTEQNITQAITGPFEVNCYMVHPAPGAPLFIIDPGSDYQTVAEAAKKIQADERVILLTHAHIDHIAGLGKLTEILNISKVFLHSGDSGIYNSPSNCIAGFYPPAENLPATEQPQNTEYFTVFHTPGHSPGSVCYYFPALKSVFTGDTLFEGSVGRTDLPGSGTLEELKEGVIKYIFTLPEETSVFPGHGGSSTVKQEITQNPYF